MFLQRLTPSAADPEITRPEPERLIEGDPVHTTWSVEEDRGLYCGIWQSTPGAWRCTYEEWEYIYVHEGRAVITGDDGERLEIGPGDSFIMRPGFTGEWRVLETIRKDYVILFR